LIGDAIAIENDSVAIFQIKTAFRDQMTGIHEAKKYRP
jgi:hypothetical protein